MTDYEGKSLPVSQFNPYAVCWLRPKKINCLFPVTARKNRVGRSVKRIFFALFFWSKMCVLCMFYVD